MKSLNASQIKKIILGLSASDGYIDLKNQRFDFYSSKKDYAEYTLNVLNCISGLEVKIKSKYDKRFDTQGWRVWTNKHPYFKNIGNLIYPNGKKELTTKLVKKLDTQSLACIWMSDGTLANHFNYKDDKFQQRGWICFEAFTKEEQKILVKYLESKFDIKAKIKKCKWGTGWRIRLTAKNLQKFLSIIYPFILDCFQYKTTMFYKNTKGSYIEDNLSNAEHIIKEYSSLDDIKKHLNSLP